MKSRSIYKNFQLFKKRIADHIESFKDIGIGPFFWRGRIKERSEEMKGIVWLLLAVIVALVLVTSEVEANVMRDEQGNRIHKTVEGDCPWGISVANYGTGFYWPWIMVVNKLKNPRKLPVGMELIIPEIVPEDQVPKEVLFKLKKLGQREVLITAQEKVKKQETQKSADVTAGDSLASNNIQPRTGEEQAGFVPVEISRNDGVEEKATAAGEENVQASNNNLSFRQDNSQEKSDTMSIADTGAAKEAVQETKEVQETSNVAASTVAPEEKVGTEGQRIEVSNTSLASNEKMPSEKKFQKTSFKDAVITWAQIGREAAMSLNPVHLLAMEILTLMFLIFVWKNGRRKLEKMRHIMCWERMETKVNSVTIPFYTREKATLKERGYETLHSEGVPNFLSSSFKGAEDSFQRTMRFFIENMQSTDPAIKERVEKIRKNITYYQKMGRLILPCQDYSFVGGMMIKAKIQIMRVVGKLFPTLKTQNSVLP